MAINTSKQVKTKLNSFILRKYFISYFSAFLVIRLLLINFADCKETYTHKQFLLHQDGALILLHQGRVLILLNQKFRIACTHKQFPVHQDGAPEERPELGEGKNELEAMRNKMHQGELDKVNNPVTSLVSAGFQTANGKQISISEEGQKSVQNYLREFQGNLQETDYETELKDIKARISNKIMECKFRKTASTSAQIANKTSFQAATRKRELQDCLQEKYCETELKDVKDRMECKFKKMAKSSAQIDKTTGFQTANGKNVLISEKGKKLVEGLLNEFHQSEKFSK